MLPHPVCISTNIKELYARLAVFPCVYTLVSVGKVDESKCKKLYTYGYGYRQFFHVSQSSVHQVSEGALLNMRFWVKARSNAHVLFSTSPAPEETDPVYEVVLGAGKNTSRTSGGDTGLPPSPQHLPVTLSQAPNSRAFGFVTLFILIFKHSL